MGFAGKGLLVFAAYRRSPMGRQVLWPISVDCLEMYEVEHLSMRPTAEPLRWPLIAHIVNTYLALHRSGLN
jgi:hypothetical protein